MEKAYSIYLSDRVVLVGSAIIRTLKTERYSNIVTALEKELDITNTNRDSNYYSINNTDYSFVGAINVGKIKVKNLKTIALNYTKIPVKSWRVKIKLMDCLKNYILIRKIKSSF